MTNENTTKFYAAYQELEKIAQAMQDEPEKVIDTMEEKLKRAMELNKICRERLDKVQKMLDQYKTENVGLTGEIPDINLAEDEKTVNF